MIDKINSDVRIANIANIAMCLITLVLIVLFILFHDCKDARVDKMLTVQKKLSKRVIDNSIDINNLKYFDGKYTYQLTMDGGKSVELKVDGVTTQEVVRALLKKDGLKVVRNTESIEIVEKREASK